MKDGGAGERDKTHLMLSSSFLPGHHVPTPMKLPPLGLTVDPMIRRMDRKAGSYLPHLLLTELLVSAFIKRTLDLHMVYRGGECGGNPTRRMHLQQAYGPFLPDLEKVAENPV